MSSKLRETSSRVVALLPQIVAILGTVAALIATTHEIIEASKRTHGAVKGLRGHWASTRSSKEEKK